MKTTFGLVALGLLLAGKAQSQSKVFKEVSDEISSQIRIIKQDNDLVGYLAFSQLEKASEDSFNYRISIMDENLNDIGKVEFRERWLSLGAVAFESDVLCLGLFKSNVAGKAYKNKKDFEAITANTENAVVMRFLNLEGKTLATQTIPVEVETLTGNYSYKYVRTGLKEGIQLANVPGKGFVCYFGEDGAGQLVAFDTKGTEKWKRGVPGNAGGHYLLGAVDAAYLLTQARGQGEGGFDIKGFGFAANEAYDKYDLKDKAGSSLKVLGSDVDPATGKPYVTGMVINSDRDGIYTMRDVTKMPYTGVFTAYLNGPKKGDRKETFSYWQSGQQSFVTKKGKLTQTNAYPYLSSGFADYQGNTYFAGSSIIKKPKWGSIFWSVATAPLFLPSLVILSIGTSKCKTTDAVLLKQSPDGKLEYATTIPCNHSRFRPSKYSFSDAAPQKSFYKVSNPDTKTDYLIVDDIKDIVVYNVTQSKVVRTIPHKDGAVRTNLFPAKEGHVMVTEYNKKEKYTRVSIESL